MVKTKEVWARGERLAVHRGAEEAGHAFLFVLHKDLHTRPFGLMEDVRVDERFHGLGVGKELVAAVIERARSERCYKLLATSRNDGSRQSVHEWYLRLGFLDYGTEFRLNF